MAAALFAGACSEAAAPSILDENRAGASSGEGGGGGGDGPGDTVGGGGGIGDAGSAPVCEGDLLDCDDCPSLEDFRESCAEASRTTCGGTMVGPLGTAPFSYTYCYAGDGTLIGRISEDSDFPSSRSVDGSDCAAEGPSEQLCEDGPHHIVTSASETIRIDWFNYFSGGYRFERRVDQLTTEQRELADAIQLAPPTGQCWADATEMTITITESDSEHEFTANEFSGTCGRDVTLVHFDAVAALLATVDCLSAKGYDGETPESAPSINADDGCFHGLFNGTGSQPHWWFRVEIPSAGEYDFVIDACGDRSIQLDLFEADATTSLASTAGTAECPTLTQAFAAAGSYLLRADMIGGNYAGDFYLAVKPRSSQ